MEREEPGIEVENDPAFHRRMWRMRRRGWIAMQVIALAGLAGLLGPGPLSLATAEHPAGLRVEHNRFARADAPQTLRVHAPATMSRPEGYRLALSRRFLDRIQIDEVTPPPVAAETTSDRIVFVFAGSPALTATFHFTPRSTGFMRAEVAGPDASPLSFWMVVYP